jgi:hypothetical protein
VSHLLLPLNPASDLLLNLALLKTTKFNWLVNGLLSSWFELRLNGKSLSCGTS